MGYSRVSITVNVLIGWEYRITSAGPCPYPLARGLAPAAGPLGLGYGRIVRYSTICRMLCYGQSQLDFHQI